MKKINILGTEYTILMKNYAEEEKFGLKSISGFCSEYSKEIIVCNMETDKHWIKESKKDIKECHKMILRHEIVHAYLNESGLLDSSYVFNEGWANNEEMVDWISTQIPKIAKTYKELNIL